MAAQAMRDLRNMDFSSGGLDGSLRLTIGRGIRAAPCSRRVQQCVIGRPPGFGGGIWNEGFRGGPDLPARSAALPKNRAEPARFGRHMLLGRAPESWHEV